MPSRKALIVAGCAAVLAVIVGYVWASHRVTSASDRSLIARLENADPDAQMEIVTELARRGPPVVPPVMEAFRKTQKIETRLGLTEVVFRMAASELRSATLREMGQIAKGTDVEKQVNLMLDEPPEPAGARSLLERRTAGITKGWVMSRQPSHRAFTLIEVLVVVAIIALLLSILLPSLARARENARSVVCLSNVHQLAQAFVTYSIANRNRLPGNREDCKRDQNNKPIWGEDWLGGDNAGLPVTGLDGALGGRQPEYGTIFKKEMGGMREAYVCPADSNVRTLAAQGCGSFHSYTANLLLAGARTETLVGAHYPKPLNGSNPAYDRADHRTNMAPFEHVPMIIEGSWDYYIRQVDDSGWCNDDSISDRHLREGTKTGYGNIGYADGHATPFRVPRRFPLALGSTYLTANYLCIRAGGRWVSGLSWPRGPGYGCLDDQKVTPSASSLSPPIQH